MSHKKSYIKTYVREANLRLYYLIYSWFICLICCYLKSAEIIYLIIKPTLTGNLNPNYLAAKAAAQPNIPEVYEIHRECLSARRLWAQTNN